MSSVPYMTTVGNLSKIGDFCTVLINSFLIFITHYHIKDITSAYKTLIMLLSALGIVFSILDFFIQPFMHSYNSSFNYFTISPVFGASKQLKTFLLLLYSCLYAVFICLIAIQFIYRFILITGSRNIRFFTRRKCHWLFFYVLAGVTIWILSLTCGREDQFSNDYLRNEMLLEYDSDVEEVPGYFMIFYEHHDSHRNIHLNGLLYVSGVSIFLLSQYSVILYCSLRIQAKITSLMTSSKIHRIQKQLFRTLVIQTLTPSIFHHSPIFLAYLICFLDLNVSFPSGVMICFFSFFPVVDSLILMNFVAEYRKVIKNLLFGKLPKSTSTQENKT